MGQVVKVKPGYARNFLLPQKKALRATKDNLAYFETQRAQLEAKNLDAQQRGRAGRRQARRAQGRADPPGRRERPALRLGHRRATSPTRSPRPASPSSRARSCSTGRSRRSACTRSASRSIRRSWSSIAANVAELADEAEFRPRPASSSPKPSAPPCEAAEAAERASARGRGTDSRPNRPRARRMPRHLAEGEAAAEPTESRHPGMRSEAQASARKQTPIARCRGRDRRRCAF